MSTSAPSTRFPFTRALPSAVFDVAALPDGRLAVLTEQGVSVLDASLETVAESPGGDIRERRLLVLADGRLLVTDPTFGRLHLATPGAPFAKVEIDGDGYATSTAVTRHGFFSVVTDERLLIDRDGTRRLMRAKDPFHHGAVAFRDGALAAGHDGFVLFDADGEIRGKHACSLEGPPVPVAGGLIAPSYSSLVWIDEAGHQATFPAGEKTAALVPFESGFVRADSREVTYHEVRDGRLEAGFRFSKDGMAPPAALSNGLLVMSSSAHTAAWIRDTKGEMTEVALPSRLTSACAFGDGVALGLQGSPDVLWWRPGGQLLRLVHDIGPRWLWETPLGLVSSEEERLCLWRAGEQGPELPELDPGDIPLNTMIVLGGRLVTVRPGGRFALRGASRMGHPVRVRPGTPFRRLVTKQEAQDRIQTLVAARSPEPAEPDPSFPSLEELGVVAGMSARRILASIRAGRFPLEPPRELLGHEYLGSFFTSTKLSVCDPCYLAHTKKTVGISLALRLEALGGWWHTFVRPGADDDQDLTAELYAIHDRGFDVVADERLGAIGVDSGRAGVFDKTMRAWDEEAPHGEGVFFGQCAVASTGYGDGVYDVFGGRVKGELAKIRVHFLGPTPPELDTTLAKALAASRPYSPKERFEVGERIEHKKFGPGTVTRVDGGKMVVVFGEDSRTLLCGT